MTFGSLFAGIGGLDLGLESAGMKCLWQVEIDAYCRQILEQHWPKVKRYDDIRTITGDELESVDLICGGFPCQDLSQAGKRAGIQGPRSGLWFEFARLVGRLGPRYILIENVPGLLVHDAMRRVIGELARLGYVGCWRSLRASEFGASHLRKRIFIVAYCADNRSSSSSTAHNHNGNHASRHDPDRCDPLLADSPSGGLGELRQPSGSDGFLDRNGKALAHTGHAGLRRPAEPSGLDWQRPSGHDCGTSGALADTGNRLLPDPWRETERRNEFESGSKALADPECAGLEVGDGQREQYLQQATESLAPGLPAFAPGPANSRWPDILRDRPDLAPALESPLRGVADGFPHWLDPAMRQRTKRLGRLGNAVVPQIAEWIGRKILEFEK